MHLGEQSKPLLSKSMGALCTVQLCLWIFIRNNAPSQVGSVAVQVLSAWQVRLLFPVSWNPVSQEYVATAPRVVVG